jgi:hypothetical protein
LVGRTVEVARQLGNGSEIGARGAGGVISTLEFLEHQLSQMGHRDLLVTAPYRDSSDATQTIKAGECARVSVCRFGFVQVAFCSFRRVRKRSPRGPFGATVRGADYTLMWIASEWTTVRARAGDFTKSYSDAGTSKSCWTCRNTSRGWFAQPDFDSITILNVTARCWSAPIKLQLRYRAQRSDQPIVEPGTELSVIES